MSFYATGGAKISIGTTVVATTAPQYAADTYTLINEIDDLGEFGDEQERVTFKSLSDNRLRKVKGSADAGMIDLVVARDPADAGQVALRTAAKAAPGYNFKVELTDKPLAGASPKNTVFYFKALVRSARNTLGGTDDVTKQKFSLDITSEILEVAAAGT